MAKLPADVCKLISKGRSNKAVMVDMFRQSQQRNVETAGALCRNSSGDVTVRPLKGETWVERGPRRLGFLPGEIMEEGIGFEVSQLCPSYERAVGFIHTHPEGDREPGFQDMMMANEFGAVCMLYDSRRKDLRVACTSRKSSTMMNEEWFAKRLKSSRPKDYPLTDLCDHLVQKDVRKRFRVPWQRF